jgi:stage II sporulation protein R
MKKFVGFILIFATLTVCFCGCAHEENCSRYLRIHIKANANDLQSQNVKYAVKDKVTAYLTPLLAECDSKEKALILIKGELKNIENVCKIALEENGLYYGASAALVNELYPARDYDGFMLKSGYYDSLVIRLGEGLGDNWWCMVYPPLCFTGGEIDGSGKITYKSKIAEIIEKFKSNN